MPSLERMLYGFPPPNRKRDPAKPMRVLALGYSRSGTESLRAALQALGYDHTYHGYDVPLEQAGEQKFICEAWTYLGRRKYGHLGGIADYAFSLFGVGNGGGLSQPLGDCKITANQFDSILGHCEAVTDSPCVSFAPELIQAYPEAKVILNIRDEDAWFHSWWDTFGAWTYGIEGWKGWARSWFCAELYWLERTKVFTQHRMFYDDFERHGKWVYRQHCNTIRGMVPKEKLLEWHVDEGWEPLCHFLSKEVPKNVQFPEGNMGADFATRVAGYLQDWNAKADQRMAVIGAGLSLLFGLMVLSLNMWLGILNLNFERKTEL